MRQGHARRRQLGVVRLLAFRRHSVREGFVGDECDQQRPNIVSGRSELSFQIIQHALILIAWPDALTTSGGVAKPVSGHAVCDGLAGRKRCAQLNDTIDRSGGVTKGDGPIGSDRW